MVEEVFATTSNSQIYINEYLTPYFNRLFLIARTAKRDGKLASASSFGGRIRARKSIDDAPILIVSESQLQALIDADDTNTSISQQHAQELMNSSHSTSQQSRTSTESASKPNSRYRNRSRANKPNIDSSSTSTGSRKRKQEKKDNDTQSQTSKKHRDGNEIAHTSSIRSN